MFSSKAMWQALTAKMSREFCSQLSKIKPDKLWARWERSYSTTNLQTFLDFLRPEEQLALMRWFHSNSVFIVNKYGLGERGEYDVTRFKEIEVGFTLEKCNLMFGERSARLWQCWNEHNHNGELFVTNIQSFDKYHVLLCFD